MDDLGLIGDSGSGSPVALQNGFAVIGVVRQRTEDPAFVPMVTVRKVGTVGLRRFDMGNFEMGKVTTLIRFQALSDQKSVELGGVFSASIYLVENARSSQNGVSGGSWDGYHGFLDMSTSCLLGS